MLKKCYAFLFVLCLRTYVMLKLRGIESLQVAKIENSIHLIAQHILDEVCAQTCRSLDVRKIQTESA